jgi:hypothetical protein
MPKSAGYSFSEEGDELSEKSHKLLVLLVHLVEVIEPGASWPRRVAEGHCRARPSHQFIKKTPTTPFACSAPSRAQLSTLRARARLLQNSRKRTTASLVICALQRALVKTPLQIAR